jgi:hypothetical protein
MADGTATDKKGLHMTTRVSLKRPPFWHNNNEQHMNNKVYSTVHHEFMIILRDVSKS